MVALSLAACNDSPKMTPHFLDTQLGEMREYEVIDKTQLTLKFKEAHSMSWGRDTYGNGFFCIPGEEARLWREYYLKKQSCKSVTEDSHGVRLGKPE